MVMETIPVMNTSSKCKYGKYSAVSVMSEIIAFLQLYYQDNISFQN